MLPNVPKLPPKTPKTLQNPENPKIPQISDLADLLNKGGFRHGGGFRVGTRVIVGHVSLLFVEVYRRLFTKSRLINDIV